MMVFLSDRLDINQNKEPCKTLRIRFRYEKIRIDNRAKGISWLGKIEPMFYIDKLGNESNSLETLKTLIHHIGSSLACKCKCGYVM